MKKIHALFAAFFISGFAAFPAFAMESVTTITTVTVPQLLTLADFELTYAGTKPSVKHQMAKEKYDEYRAATPDSTTVQTVARSSSTITTETSRPVTKSTTVTTDNGLEKSTVVTTSSVPAPVVQTTVTNSTTQQY